MRVPSSPRASPPAVRLPLSSMTTLAIGSAVPVAVSNTTTVTGVPPSSRTSTSGAVPPEISTVCVAGEYVSRCTDNVYEPSSSAGTAKRPSLSLMPLLNAVDPLPATLTPALATGSPLCASTTRPRSVAPRTSMSNVPEPLTVYLPR